MKTTAPGSPTEEGASEEAPERFNFRSSKGRADLNPYVERIAEHGEMVLTAEQAEEQRGRWRAVVGGDKDAPLLLEIGPGNGFFFADLISRFPEAAVLAVEIRFKRVWMTADKARRSQQDNFRVIHHHSGYLDLLFAPGELNAVYVNHPDPWPKERHHKHRLLQPSFADSLESYLRPGGEIWVKSDFSPYGALTREVFSGDNWEELAYTADLHGEGQQLLNEAPSGARFWCADSETNYERKSRRKGETIMLAGYRLASHDEDHPSP
jgi:tRNA (guanine-N7-)-methyltransferase